MDMVPYIRNAGHNSAFEFALIQFFHGSLQVVGGLEFNKPFPLSIEVTRPGSGLRYKNLPFSLFTAGFRVDNVQSRLTGEVFQILEKVVSPGSRK